MGQDTVVIQLESRFADVVRKRAEGLGMTLEEWVDYCLRTEEQRWRASEFFRKGRGAA